MKKIILIVSSVCCCLAVDAQGLLNRRALRSVRARQIAPLAELMPFADAVKLAKTGDGFGLYALAVYVSQGKEVASNPALAYKYLCAAANAGNANAIFIKHLLEENASDDNYSRVGNIDSYIGGWGQFACTNKFCDGVINVGEKDVAEKLLGLYRSDVERGVSAATNEIARIEEEIKRVEEANEKKRIAEENRKRNAALLDSELGDKVVEERPAAVPPFTSLRTRRLMREQQQVLNRKSKLLEELMPFADAVPKAKVNDGAGLYAVAIHYAKGKEIEQDNSKAAKYLQKAVDVNYSNAVFIAAMVAESRLSTSVGAESGPMLRRGGLGNGDVRPDSQLYTDGVSLWCFTQGNAGNQTSFTNNVDVAAVSAMYKKAFGLGVAAATNELARFEKRVEVVQAALKKKLDDIKAHDELLDKNAQLAKDLLGEETESDRRKAELAERVAEREEQRRQLQAIQEELRRAREERAKEMEQQKK